jgi:hypothetical protein
MDNQFSVQPPQSYGSIPQSSTLAIISLISGIAAWVILPLLGAIAAVITGHMAKKEIRESNGMKTGDGMATAGLILGYAQLAITICSVCIIVVLALLIPAAGMFENFQ